MQTALKCQRMRVFNYLFNQENESLQSLLHPEKRRVSLSNAVTIGFEKILFFFNQLEQTVGKPVSSASACECSKIRHNQKKAGITLIFTLKIEEDLLFPVAYQSSL